MAPIELGDEVEHKLTRAKGIVVGITKWLYLTNYSVTVQPRCNTANVKASQSIEDGTPAATWTCMDTELLVVQSGAIDA